MPATQSTQTEKKTKTFVGLIVYKIEEGEIRFLVIEYIYDGQTQIKFPGGMMLKGESFAATMRRECIDEGEVGTEDIEKAKDITVFPVSDRTIHSQRKVFFACRDWPGELRTQMKEDGDDEISPPYWIDSYGADTNLFYHHRNAFTDAIPKIAQRDQEFLRIAIEDAVLRRFLPQTVRRP